MRGASVHHLRQPQALAAYSIALVNSFGNVGGFAGTYILGYLHDTLGGASGGASDWGWGTIIIGAFFVFMTACTGLALRDRACYPRDYFQL